MFLRKFSSLGVVSLAVVMMTGNRAHAAAAPAAQPPKPAASTPSAGQANAEAGRKLDLFGDTLVAKGKSVAVKRSDLDEAMVNIKSAAAANNQEIPPQQMGVIEQQVLDRLIQIQLLKAKATDADKAAAKETTDRRMEAIKKSSSGEEVLNRKLKALGTSQEELRGKMNEEATAQNVLERELKIKVSDEEAKKYYEDNPAKFEQPEMVHVSHILFATKDLATGKDLPADKKAEKKKQAEEVLKRARAGEDFAKLVKEFSDDPGSKDNGGEYTFARASADPRHAMVPEFENAAFGLKTNEVSDLVTTQFGYHIIKLLEKLPAKQIEFAKVAPDIKEFLKQQQLQSRQQDYQDYIEKLKKDAEVAVLDDRLKLPDTASQPVSPGGAAPAPGSPPAK
jgi:parvulin-like peptidyl-prolyl isomerase